jgi:diguanylate cyclase (GGDEF)-like protein
MIPGRPGARGSAECHTEAGCLSRAPSPTLAPSPLALAGAGAGAHLEELPRREAPATGEDRAGSATARRPPDVAAPAGPGLEAHATTLVQAARSLHDRVRALAAGRHGPLGPEQEHAARLAEHDALAAASAAEGILAVLGSGAHRAVGLPPPPDLPADAAARHRVLLCDDDPEHREAIADALSRDHDVTALGDGVEALDAAFTAPPDLLLLDLRLPGYDGLAVLEGLRSVAGTAEVPVILLSGHADDASRVRALELGAVDVLQKPVSLRELRARVDRALRLARSQSQLRAMARTDVLTGLANLRAFLDRLEAEVRRARRHGTPLTCVMADMDRLKPVNDELGHAAGDRAIAAVADVLRTELRASDLGARYGGDEFVLLLPHTTAAEGMVLAGRICARLADAHVEVAGRRLALRASFGVAELAAGPAFESPADLLRRADQALYAAKRSGRGQAQAHAGARGLALPDRGGAGPCGLPQGLSAGGAGPERPPRPSAA